MEGSTSGHGAGPRGHGPGRTVSTRRLPDRSRRKFLVASLKGRYLSCATAVRCTMTSARPNTTGTDEGFEVGGGDLTPHVPLDHGRSATEARAVWLGIARPRPRS